MTAGAGLRWRPLAAAGLVAALTASCSAIGADPSPTPTAGADRAAAGPDRKRTEKQKQKRKLRKQQEAEIARRLVEPPGLNVSVNSSGMTISWLAVDNASGGYAVAVDGAWRVVRKTKVHYDELLPGLRYHVQVAAVADGRRGEIAETYVDPQRGPTPRTIMTPTQPSAPPTTQPPPSSPTASAPVPQPADLASAPAPAIAAEEMLPQIDSVTTNGCGFDGSGRIDLLVTVRLADADAQAPALLTDDAGGLYIPSRSAGPDATPERPVAVFEPEPDMKPAGTNAITRAVFVTGSPARDTGYAHRDIGRVEWGSDLCEPTRKRGRW